MTNEGSEYEMITKTTILLLSIITCCGLVTPVTGAPISGRDGVIDNYEVHNASIHAVCKQLSAFSGIDIIVSNNIKSNVTLSVTKKTWKEILEIVCKINNLYASNEGSYIYILSSSEKSKRYVESATNLQATKELDPLKREVIKIKHTPATDIEKPIRGLLSTRGKITVVSHNNAIIVYDTDENITQIRNMISQLDIETAQISISCKIIEVSSGVVQNMGIHWGYSSDYDNVQVEHIPKPTAQGGVAAGALERISYGILQASDFSAALEYLYGDNKGEIVAQPQITTIDNKQARIFMGQQIPVKYLDEAGNTVVRMINAGTQLIVKPHISGEGRILLELNPKKESYTQQADGTPVINEQSAQTNVVVNNGETVVIAGLTSNEMTNAETGIPFLKDIPFLGAFFKRSQKTRDKKDLIIFVTPYILNNNLASAAAQTPDEISVGK